MVVLNESDLRSLTYNDLKQLAQEHQVYKNGKKSKEALIKRLLKSKDGFGKSELSVDEEDQRAEESDTEVTRRETFLVENSNLPENNRRGTFDVIDPVGCAEHVQCKATRIVESPQRVLPKANRRGRKRVTEKSPERLENCVIPQKVMEDIKSTKPKSPKQIDVPPLTRQGTFTLEDQTAHAPAAKGPESKNSSIAVTVKVKTGKAKRVDFVQMTPTTPKERKMTINKTPIPMKASLAKKLSVGLTPGSVKKTPHLKRLSRDQPIGQFSARKMPDFAEIHRRNFHKMESLVDYKERKAGRARALFSPSVKFQGNATFTEGTGSAQKRIDKEAKRSFIPVRKNARVNGKENLETKSFSMKPSSTKESLKERQRELVRGVRTNKRFLLQMKARGLD